MLLKVWKLLQYSSIFIEKSKSCPALLSNLKLGKSLVNLNKTACPTLPIQSRHLTTNIMEDPSSCRTNGSTCGKELTEEDKKDQTTSCHEDATLLTSQDQMSSDDASDTLSHDQTTALHHDPSLQESQDQASRGATPLSSPAHDQPSPKLGEIFKIKLNNIPARMGYQNLKKYLNSLNLKPGRVKKPGNQPGTAFINFRCEEDRKVALEVLNGRIWKKKTLMAKRADLTPNPMQKRKRPIEQDAASVDAKRAKIDPTTLKERLAGQVTPLLSQPYHKQLQQKYEHLEEMLKQMGRMITRRESHPGEWFDQHLKRHGGLICPLDPVRKSPCLEGYRNKCEFSIGTGITSGQVVVGFRLGSFEEGDSYLTIVSAEDCVHIPERAKELAKLFEKYLRGSHLPPYSDKNEQGYWRMLTLRCHESGESMAILQIHPQDLTMDAIEVEKARLVEFFKTGEGAQAPPTSLYFQALGRLEANVKPSYDHLFGEKHIHENLFDLKFRISPPSFFQVNTQACEVLYSVIKELATVEGVEHPLIYDICCGTGTIGLYLAKAMSASKVVGVEMVEEAVRDARVNAGINGVSNVNFVCGRAEDVMQDIRLPASSYGKVVGIVDPPRAGLHPKVIQTIRKCYPIQRLIYISCKPNAAKGNIVDLCRRKSNWIKGFPFRPVRAIPVDLFPHTPHCELVILLERLSEKEARKEAEKNRQNNQEELARAQEEAGGRGEEFASLERLSGKETEKHKQNTKEEDVR